ncbi:hypothetical protein P3L44_18560 [Providencia sp. PROV175]|uniref:hypothetical protein n=2 Tax=Providencia sp. PROV175 TaxID=2949878 RepID=UPI002935135C|nr:hypothetical protein [Providencia sp. PROV175]WOB90659.1 hypothetical protein P3L44_18560 [Providencia sp. PROV175]
MIKNELMMLKFIKNEASMVVNYSYLDKEVYGYMRKNKIFCYLIWRILKSSSACDLYFHQALISSGNLTLQADLSCVIRNVTNVAADKIFLFEPKSHEGRYIESTEYISFAYEKLRLFRYNEHAWGIHQMLHYLRSYFIKIKSNYKYFAWLKASDNKTCEWVYDYLVKSKVLDKTEYQDNEELYLYIVTGFYLWQPSQDEKDKRYKKLLLARNERKHRTTSPSKGSVRPKKSPKDIQLSAEARTKLTELALSYGVPASEWLNSFIIDEYEKMK